MPRARTLLLLLGASLLSAGCKETHSAPSSAELADYLMPPRVSRAELLMERRVSGPGRQPLVQPRMVVAERTREGIVYAIRERVEEQRWRTAAKLFFRVADDGAWLTRQEDLTGQPVGVREPRLQLPWPLTKGTKRSLGYRLLGSHDDGAGRAGATVTVTRTGFATQVGPTRYAPCVEVREVIAPAVGGALDLRSVYCRGFGRVRIEQRNETLSRGESLVVDRALGIRMGGK